MDVSLTDLLVCPHCGPPFGLILLADAVAERRVLAGTLGCANCYRRYGVRAGVADLRPGPEEAESRQSQGAREPGARPEPAQATSSAADVEAAQTASGSVQGAASPEAAAGGGGVPVADHAFRLVALMGLADASGSAGRPIALLAGPVALEAPAVTALAPGYEIVAAGGGEVVSGVERLAEEAGVSRILVADRLPFFDGSLRGVVLGGEAADRLLEEAVRVLNPMGRLVVEDTPPGAAERIAAAGGRVVAAEGSTVVAVTLRGLSVGP